MIQHLSELLAYADGSTLYLDEITDISLPVQKEFLRLLDGKTNDIEPVGAGFARDIRVIAAMGKDLRDAIEGDLVSRGFLNRVSAVSIKMPPLRERKEDICLLVNHFLNK